MIIGGAPRQNGCVSENNSLDSISILFNNSYVVDDYAICGTRGWFLENESQNDIKVLNREVGRLEMSIQSAIKTGKEPIVFYIIPLFTEQQNVTKYLMFF